MILAGLIAATGLLFLVMKLGIRKIIKYDIILDVLITAVLMYSLAGTYSGMMAALLGGLFVSVILFVLKKTITREELRVGTDYIRVNKHIKVPTPNFYWEKVDPKS